MASTKSFFLASLALAAVVLCVESSPEYKRTVLRSDFVAGQRESGDYLSKFMMYSESHSSAEPMQIKKSIQVYEGETITQIVFKDQSSESTKVSIASGGPGQSEVVLVFENPKNVIKGIVQIFVKN